MVGAGICYYRMIGENICADLRRGEMQLEDIETVMARYESRWMALDGVEGVAIGESRDGKSIIVIYADPVAKGDLMKQIPSSVDGHEVSFEPEPEGFVAL